MTGTASDGSLWLRVSHPVGDTPTKANATIDTNLLPNGGTVEGVYNGRILIETSAGKYTIPVSVEISNSALNQVNPLFFTMKQGGPSPLPQFVPIASISGAAATFALTSTASLGGNWLQASTNSSSQQTIKVSVTSASSLPQGTYTGQFLITNGATPRPVLVVPVTLSILPTLSLGDAPGGLYFNIPVGGGNPPGQTLPMRAPSLPQISWHAEPAYNFGNRWLTASDSGGFSIETSIDVSRLPGAGQTPGIYTTQIIVDSQFGELSTIPVVVTVGDNYPKQLQPQLFSRGPADAPPLSQWPLILSSSGANPLAFTTSFSTSTGGSWLNASPIGTCCATPQLMRVRVLDAPSLAVGTYTGQIEIASAPLTQVVPVGLQIVPANTPRFDSIPGQLSFSTTTSGGAIASQPLSIRNATNGTLNWGVILASEGNWLGVDFNTSFGSGDGNVVLTVNRAQLPNGGTVPGTYQGQVLLTSLSSYASVPVSVIIGETFQQTSAVNFTSTSSQNVALNSTTGNSFAFSGLTETGRGGNWLQALRSGANCCSTPETVTLSAAGTGLAPDTYIGQYVAYRDKSATVVPVRFTVGSTTRPIALDVTGNYTLVPGASVQLTATARYSNGSRGNVTAATAWTSSNTAVATIGPNSGVLTGLTGGSSTISATFEGITTAFPIVVNTSGPVIVEVSPYIASPGDTITITGAGFNPDFADVWVSGYQIPNAQLVSKSATRIVFNIPNSVPFDTHFVTVRNTNTGAASNSPNLYVGPRTGSGAHFTPIAPCRVADTRIDIPSGIPTNSFRNFDLSTCVPYYATAVAVNITLVPRGQLGYLSVWPTGQPQPVVSTMNSLDGRIKANAAIVGLGTNRQISVYVTHAADVVLDVSGYFLQAGDPRAYAFYPAPPCRVLDTRLSGGIIPAQGTRTVGGGCLPTNGPRGYSLNVTVVPSGPLGYLTLWPDGLQQPTASTLNNLTGTVVANAALIEPGNGGNFNAFVTNETHMIVDFNGYFRPSGEPGSLTFYPVTPCRIVDTRNPNGAFGGPAMAADSQRDFNVPASSCGIPSTARAYVLNATVVPPGPFGFLTLWPAASARPVVSTLNAIDGALTSNLAIVPAGPNGVISAYTSSSTHLLLDISGYFAP
ncbi:hypothetical protein F183_A12860 [Bryobacterales bacterium F-183]|nr:hypothetical protein F183_A12860 [Bryobacterales bacterium F-183]